MNETPLNAQWVQKQIKVKSITVDTFISDGHPVPDLIWSDVQGAELLVFQGAEKALPNIKAIYTEAGKKPYYHGQTLIPEIDSYLKTFGFKCVMELRGTHDFESDFLYINENY